VSEEKISFQGRHRKALKGVTVYPRPERPLQVWRGVGGSPESVLEAAAMDMPLVMAIIGGNPARFAPLADLYRNTRQQMGAKTLPIGVHSPGHVAATDEEARDRYFPAYATMHDLIGRSRGWPRLTRAAFEAEIAHGSLYVGSPETVAQKIATAVRALGLSRFTLKYSAGPQDPAHLLDTIELYGTKVAPRVRELLA
jgi:alkanesulfonate monooxygenase SsuD/methylene tetrahydromethanopterin reductase-like flavin-dependent oxidoreductase (luciferase family)